jgi:hypothetical protein
MYGNVDFSGKNTQNSGGRKEKCTKLLKTEGKMYRILEDVTENAPNPRGQKTKCAKV